MTTRVRKLANPPIVEAVLDIDCDVPIDTDFESLEEAAKKCFGDEYPKSKTRFVLEHEVRDIKGESPQASTRRNVDAFMFLREDERQLVQVRAQGFSFNRLAPYSTLDDYLSDIEKAWFRYLELAKPVQVSSLRLRYINKIHIPLRDDSLDLEEYLHLGPRIPGEDKYALRSFLNQYVAAEKDSGHEVKAILTSQKPESGKLPIIFDITAWSGERLIPNEWDRILLNLDSLRNLSDDVFFNTLREECLHLFK